MTRYAARRFAPLLMLVVASVLASCSGAVSGPPTTPTPPTPGTLTVTPSSATLYSDLPSTFLISGGTAPYSVTSDNQAVVPSQSGLTAAGFTVVPNSVGADTTVNLTVRDSIGSAPATAKLTVKPRTVSNVVTVTPSASQSPVCGTSLCSGGDAEVKVVLMQAGVPLVNRNVQFTVVSGDLRVITSAPGTAETLALSATATSDSTGTVRVRVRALPDATSQTAILEIEDLSSGFTQRTSVTIAAASNAPLGAQPTLVRFTGPDSSTCASNVSADVIVYGGRPPYQLTQPAAFTVSPLTLTASGQHFTITANGQCALEGLTIGSGGAPIAIVDANGTTTTITAINNPAPTTPNTTAFAVAPTAVTLDSCKAVANVLLVGGSGGYFAASGSNALTVTISGNLASIQRAAGTTVAASASPVNVAFTDGKTTEQVIVGLTSTAVGTCP